MRLSAGAFFMIGPWAITHVGFAWAGLAVTLLGAALVIRVIRRDMVAPSDELSTRWRITGCVSISLFGLTLLIVALDSYLSLLWIFIGEPAFALVAMISFLAAHDLERGTREAPDFQGDRDRGARDHPLT